MINNHVLTTDQISYEFSGTLTGCHDLRVQFSGEEDISLLITMNEECSVFKVD